MGIDEEEEEDEGKGGIERDGDVQWGLGIWLQCNLGISFILQLNFQPDFVTVIFF